MDERNRIFAAAFDELKRTQGVKSQKDLAQRMGVSEDTITRILKHGGRVTEDIISKLHAASGCVFNLQWLRGESEIMYAKDVKPSEPSLQEAKNKLAGTDQGLLLLLDRQMELIEKHAQMEINAKDETIKTLRNQLDDKEALIETLRSQILDLRAQLDMYQNVKQLEKFPFNVGVAEIREQPKERV